VRFSFGPSQEVMDAGLDRLAEMVRAEGRSPASQPAPEAAHH
jgi:hypothetical protein